MPVRIGLMIGVGLIGIVRPTAIVAATAIVIVIADTGLIITDLASDVDG